MALEEESVNPSPSDSTRRVLPSMSVNRNVTVPVGRVGIGSVVSGLASVGARRNGYRTTPMSNELAAPLDRLGSRPILAAVLGALSISFTGVNVRLANVEPATAAVFGASTPCRCCGSGPRRGAPLRAARAGAAAAGDHRRPVLRRRPGRVALRHPDGRCRAGDRAGQHPGRVRGHRRVAVLRERLTARLIGALVIALSGVVLISGVLGGEAYGENPVAGVLLGLFTGAAYAGFLLVQRLGNRDPRRPAGPLMDATASSAVASAAAGLVLGQITFLPPGRLSAGWSSSPSARRWSATCSSAWPSPAPSALTSIVLLIQPVAAVGLAMLILGESPSPTQLRASGWSSAGWCWPPPARLAAGRQWPRPRRALGGSAIVRAMTDEPLLLTGTGRLLDGPGPRRRPGRSRHGQCSCAEWRGSVARRRAGHRPLGGPRRRARDAGLVDAHTHPVFAGDRSDEAAARLSGQPYEAGGILRTVASTREASDDTLEALVEERFAAALDTGTTTSRRSRGTGSRSPMSSQPADHPGRRRAGGDPRGPHVSRRARRPARGGLGRRSRRGDRAQHAARGGRGGRVRGRVL